MTLGECRIAAQPLRFHRRFWPLLKMGLWMFDGQCLCVCVLSRCKTIKLSAGMQIGGHHVCFTFLLII